MTVSTKSTRALKCKPRGLFQRKNSKEITRITLFLWFLFLFFCRGFSLFFLLFSLKYTHRRLTTEDNRGQVEYHATSGLEKAIADNSTTCTTTFLYMWVTKIGKHVNKKKLHTRCWIFRVLKDYPSVSNRFHVTRLKLSSLTDKKNLKNCYSKSSKFGQMSLFK